MAQKKVRMVEEEIVVLGIDSNYEEVTNAAWEYRNEHVYPFFESEGFKVILCQGVLCYRRYVAPAAAEPSVDYLTGVGHGLEDLYTGQYGDPIFKVGHYGSEESNGKIVHFLSCQTAAKLGPDFVKHGCRAYFGYDINFTFFKDYADIFFECDSEIDLAFAEGLTAAEVDARARALYRKRINELRADGHLYVAATLETDLDHLMSPAIDARFGQTAARLE